MRVTKVKRIIIVIIITTIANKIKINKATKVEINCKNRIKIPRFRNNRFLLKILKQKKSKTLRLPMKKILLKRNKFSKLRDSKQKIPASPQIINNRIKKEKRKRISKTLKKKLKMRGKANNRIKIKRKKMENLREYVDYIKLVNVFMVINANFVMEKLKQVLKNYVSSFQIRENASMIKNVILCT